jgi:hypothetical protein
MVTRERPSPQVATSSVTTILGPDFDGKEPFVLIVVPESASSFDNGYFCVDDAESLASIAIQQGKTDTFLTLEWKLLSQKCEVSSQSVTRSFEMSNPLSNNECP